MSKMSTKSRQSRWDDPQRSDGFDSHNPVESDYGQKFGFRNYDPVDLKYSEESGNEIARSNSKNTDSVQQKEREPDNASKIADKSNSSHHSSRRFSRESIQQALQPKNLRKKSSLLTLLLLLFGGGGFLTIFFSPSLAIVQMKEVFSRSLNDQLHSVEQRSAILMRAKMKETTNGSCGAIKVRCRFATISNRQVEKFKSAGVNIELNRDKGFGSNRGQIEKISFTDSNGKLLEITKASELQQILLHPNNLEFQSAFTRGYNPFFASLSDRLAANVLGSLKVSKRVVATGNSNKERQNAVNEAVSGLEDPGGRTLIKKTDDKGNESYVDSEGNPVSDQEADNLRQQGDRIEDYSKNGGVRGVLTSTVKGVSIVGYMDSACTVYNSMRFVSALSKVKKLGQAARFAMAMVLTPADSIKAGDANMDDINFIGDNLTAAQQPSVTLDESKLNQAGSAGKPATRIDPEAGMNAFDSPGYKIAAYGDSPNLSLRASRFMLAGGSVALLDKVIGGVATVVNGGNANPRTVSQKCRYVQNPAVRFTGLAIGIIAGIGSFGLTTVLGIGGSVAIAMALPYIESQAADILSGNLFQNLSGVDSGDAAYVGTAGIFGTMAMNRGMKPLNKKEGTEYLAANREAYERYARVEQFAAKSHPLDVINQFSFLGSIVRTLTPVMAQSKSSASMAMMNIASLVPFSFNSLFTPARAVAGDYFDKCNDPAYKSIGIDAGPFCEVRYGLGSDELSIDPLQNIDWMIATGNIDPQSEMGDAKDNGQVWNYQKFLAQCVHRTVGWGEDQDENEGDGRNCIDPAYEELNGHFRIYTLDRSVDQSLDGDLSGGSVSV